MENIYKNNYKLIITYSIIGILSGFSSFLFIALVNQIISLSISEVMPKEHNYMLFFALIIALFFMTKRLLSEGVIEISQTIFWDIRSYVVKAIIVSPYLKVKNMKDEIYSALTADVANITNASLVIISFTSSVILTISSFIYLWYLSVPLFIISAFIISIGLLGYYFVSKSGNKHFVDVRAIEQKFMHQFDGILSGNKEIKVNREKGEEIFSKGVYPLLKRGKEKNIVAYIGYLNSQLISQVLFYIIVIFILLFVGDFFDVSLGTSISFVFALLFLFSPIVTIMLAIPPLNQGLISYNKLKDLKKKLEYEEFNNSYLNSNNDSPKVFKQVRFENCFYQYLDTSFEVGPFDLTINANEIIFVYGGNGAGKTTFIYMLLNLFTPDKGSIYFKDDEPESSEKVSQLFSPVFSDFYLFDDFYGIKNFDLEKVSSLLKLFELHDKVKIKEGKFSTLDLSAGQRKRLALIVAVLEDRPILVLDEWAADQDPYFRKKFYTEIIHKIVQEENKTIIAITHDDNYYQEADRLFKMDYGKLEEINSENTLQTKNNILT